MKTYSLVLLSFLSLTQIAHAAIHPYVAAQSDTTESTFLSLSGTRSDSDSDSDSIGTQSYSHSSLSPSALSPSAKTSNQLTHDEEKFYVSPAGSAIMDESMYSAGIRKFLQMENRAVVQRILTSKRYDSVLEVGCGMAVKANMFAQLGFDYTGIDINCDFIQLAQTSIEKQKIQDLAKVSCTSVFDYQKMGEINHSKSKTLLVFPFNLFGNLPNHEELIQNLVALNYDIYISSYTLDQAAFTARSEYYSNCKFKNLKYCRSSEKAIFLSDDGLETVAYSASYFEKLLAQFKSVPGFRYSIEQFDEIGVGILIESHSQE